MTQGSSRPRWLTVFAEAAAVLALLVAVVGVVIAAFAYEHDKDVAGEKAEAVPVITVTRYVSDTPETGRQADQTTEPSFVIFLKIVGIVVLAILSAKLVHWIWDEAIGPFFMCVISSFAAGATLAYLSWILIVPLGWAILIGIVAVVTGFYFGISS
ncbi:hypothetical protein AB0C28_49090 [Nonomuraea sp. NPDC048892]|uniref:hypothetical protein n=1 Tax=Nonomuraea sp. NPDC048892 TaxID=3154624 RepID=UPI0033CFC96F